MSAHTIELHVSGLATYQDCERLYNYSYLHGYRLAFDSPPIVFGNYWHFAQRLVAGGSSYAEALAATAARQQELGSLPDPELWEMFEGLMGGHKLWQETSDCLYVDSRLEYVSLEEKFTFELGGYQFGGVWDGVVKHKHLDGLYLIERKTTYSPNELERGVSWDMQPRFYAYAAEKIYGEPVIGVIYELVRRCNPTQIKVLKNGWPSKARNELDGTSYEIYRNFLFDTADKLGYTYETVLIDYAEQLEYLKLAHNPVFRRILVPMGEGHKEIAAKTMLYRAAQMNAAQSLGDALPPKLNRYTCSKCPFKYACLAQDDGADYISLLDATFIKDKERFDA